MSKHYCSNSVGNELQQGESRLVKQRTSSIFSMGTVPLACTWNSKGPIQNGSFPLYNLGIKKGGQYFFPSWAKYRRVSTSPYPSGQMAENKRLATYRLSCRNLLYCSLRIKKKKRKKNVNLACTLSDQSAFFFTKVSFPPPNLALVCQ